MRRAALTVGAVCNASAPPPGRGRARRATFHRDIKPDNLVLIGDPDVPGKERIKLLDFGLAKFLDSPERRTTAGMTLGTPTYMAPEQCLGSDKLDGKADVYGLGVLLYEMLSGHVPFVGEMGKVMRAHVYEAPRSVAEVAPHLPRNVVAFVMSLLVKDPTQRPDMRGVEARIDELDRSGSIPVDEVRADAPTQGHHVAYAPTMQVAAARKPAAVSVAPTTETRRRLPPKLVRGLLVAGGLVLGLVPGFLLGRTTAPPVPVPGPPAPVAPRVEPPAAKPDVPAVGAGAAGAGVPAPAVPETPDEPRGPGAKKGAVKKKGKR